MKRAILYFLCLPLDLLIAWPIVLGVRLLWGTGLTWGRGVLSCEMKPGSFPLGGPTDPATGLLLRARRWPWGFYIANRTAALRREEPPRSWGGTCLGHGIFFGPGRRSEPDSIYMAPIEVHELHHSEQAEAAQVQVFVVAAIVGAVVAAAFHDPVVAGVLAGALWTLGGYVMGYAGGAVAAWLRGRHPYRQNPYEVGADAVERSTKP